MTSARTFREQIAGLAGIGAKLSLRILDAGICTLEDLELACYDGRLRAMPGFGDGRIEHLAAELDDLLSPPAHPYPLYPRPDVALLLEVDADYRRLAADDVLPRVAPLRFNPCHHHWMPVMRTERDGWFCVAHYSNTARAFTLNKRRDWVTISYEREGESDNCSVVTEYKAHLLGLRVVRGREPECAVHYAAQTTPADVVDWAHRMAERLGEPDRADLLGADRAA